MHNETEHSGAMWGITTHFNPAGYATKLHNLELFAKNVRRQGLKLMIVELVFGDEPFSVPKEFADVVLTLRAKSVLWQKERMLRIAVDALPDDCDKVAWLDGDVLFGNENWVADTARALDVHRIVQPYDLAVWLPPGQREPLPITECDLEPLEKKPGIAFAVNELDGRTDVAFRPDLFHPGFAWAARVDILRAALPYDRFVLGGGDFMTTLGMYFDSDALQNPSVTECLAPNQVDNVRAWMNEFHARIDGDVGFTPGPIFHLWHGDIANRRYIERYEILRAHDFEPERDITIGGDGCWEWSSDKPELHRRVKDYFTVRKEDG